jgi:putative aminopeptidase FrvX
MNEKENLILLKKISEVNGISGNEKEVAKLVANELKGTADRIEHDNLGSVIAYLDGDKGEPLVMLAGHMDEVGFVVKSIEDSGLIRLHPIGGWYNHVILAENFIVRTREGKEFFAVTGAQPPHGMSPEQRAKVLDIKDMYLDLGVKDKKMVEDLGIRPGDTVTPYEEFRVMADGKTLLGKAWDDRVGVAIGIEVMKELAKEKHKANLAVAGTVQEEVGLRGARTASHYVKPDIAFALDVTMSHDLPGAPSEPCRLGAGPALSILDGSVIAHRGLFEFVEKVAKDNNIPYTYDLLSAGGTDSGEIHKSGSGVITMTISLACRYFHSHVSMINYDDFTNAVKLMVAVIKAIDKDTLAELKASKYL